MNKLEMNEVFKAIATERAYQEKLWNKPKSSVAEYLIYIQHHLNKAFSALSTTECVGVCDTVLDQIRKVTALGVACGEQHGMPLRSGFEDKYLFVTGDLITTEDDMNIYQCICSDQSQAVFAKAVLTPECIHTVYEDMFVVANWDKLNFEFKRLSIDDIRAIVSILT